MPAHPAPPRPMPADPAPPRPTPPPRRARASPLSTPYW
jgi:hypothetical protein